MLHITTPNTKRKNFLKLISISKRLIHDYGLIYFIKTALSELNKQGFSIFNPDVSESNDYNLKKQNLSDSHLYKLWLAYNSDIFDIKDVNEVISNFHYLPSIDFFVNNDNNGNKTQYLKDSIFSITNQSYENSKLLLDKKNFTALQDDNYSKELEKNSKIKIINNTDSISSKDILSSSDAEFIAFLNNGNVLSQNALLYIISFLNENQKTDVLYTDEDTILKDGNRVFPFFKPDWSPNLFLSKDYISQFFVVRKKILEDVIEKKELASLSTYDILLRITEKTDEIFHIPIPLCSIRPNTKNSTTNRLMVLNEALKRRKISGTVSNGILPNTYRVKYQIQNEPKISIIIPTKDQKKILKRCIKSLEKTTNYKNFEIIIVDNNSEKEETISYLNSLPYKIIHYNYPFNFSKINNLAVEKSTGEYLLFLNDDVAALEKDWLNEMIAICEQPDVGIVGAKLVLGNNTIQHGGMTFLKTAAGFHPFQGIYSHDEGYFGFFNVIRDCSAVTGACLLIKKKIFEQIGGFDENFDLYYGDSDLCLRVSQAGYKIVYTPHAILLHQGSTKIKEFSKSFFAVENHYHFAKKWPELKNGDPFYNPNLGWDYQIDFRNKIT